MINTLYKARFIHILLLFAFVFFISSYLLFAEVYIPVNPNQSEFIFSGFLLYNYSLNISIALFQLFIISATIQAGLFIWNIELAFSNTIKIVLISLFAFLLTDLAKALWFLMLNPEYSYDDYTHFNKVISLAGLFDFSQSWEGLNNILYDLNISRLIFILFMTIGLNAYLEKGFLESIKIVISSYGIGYLLWCTARLLIAT